MPRATLFDRLSAGGPGGVTLISAPAGSGKTVLLRSWIEDARLGERVAWVSVERGERDAQRFWMSMIDALSGAVGGDGSVQRLGAAPGFDGDAVVERLLSDLASLETRCVLVIDDLHELSSAEALGQLELLLAGMPPELRIVLATRHDPQLGLHRLRVAGALLELRAADLRFSPAEARDLLAAARDRAVGCRSGAAARSHRGLGRGPAAGRDRARGASRARAIRRGVLRQRAHGGGLSARGGARSPAARGTPPAAAHVGAGAGERAACRRAHRELGLGADPSASSRLPTRSSWRSTWGERGSATTTCSPTSCGSSCAARRPTEIAPLHRAAARWFAEHGYVVDAIRHAQAAGEWGQAARLLFDNLASLAFDGRGATTRALLAAFPAEVAAGDAELAAVFAGVELETGSLEEAAPHLAVVERLAPTVPDERRGHFDVQFGVLRLTVARRHGDLAAVVDEMRSLEAASEALSAGDVAFGNDVRAAALMDLGVAELWSSRVDDARRHLEEGIALARRIGRPWVEIACRGHLAVEAAERSLAVAREESEQAIAIAETHGLANNQVVAMALVAFGGALAWTGRFEEAERSLDRAQGLRAEAEPATEVVLQHRRGMLRAGQGRLDEALAAFRAAESSALASQPFLLAQVRGALLQTLIRQGETAAAREALDAATEREELRAAAAAVHLAEGSPQEAAELLAPALRGLGAGTSSRRSSSRPPRRTGSATRVPRRPRSSGRSSSPSPTGSSCRSSSPRAAS